MVNSTKDLGGAPVGNDNAKKAKIWSEALRKHITQNHDLPKLAKALVNKALEGDVTAMKEIGDRLEGKVVQRVEGSGEGGEFTIKLIERVIIDNAADKNT